MVRAKNSLVIFVPEVGGIVSGVQLERLRYDQNGWTVEIFQVELRAEVAWNAARFFSFMIETR